MFTDDPADMSIDDRLDELTALLAAGFLRLKRRTGCLPPSTSESVESSRIPPDSPCDFSESMAPCHKR
ncbi:MAG: hypothetical protein JW849_03835 [Phycisphaerae bacterium]|nr:hypothetical protein [Phycisphaerae bacterium]